MSWARSPKRPTPMIPLPLLANIVLQSVMMAVVLPPSLELGAGGGLVGLAVASGCQLEQQLLLTDQAEMLSLMHHNVALNGLGAHVRPMILNWGERLPQAVIDIKPDVILAADCVYFEPAFPLLMQTLSELLALNSEATIYFCFMKRRRADMRFLKEAQKRFRVEQTADEDRPVFSRQSLFLYTFRSKVVGGS